jgi:DNA-binding GntR family transcriptional regulator
MSTRRDKLPSLQIGDVPTVRSIVRQKLRDAIISGTLVQGQRLVERELCEMTGVSRASIREAMRWLEAEGLVTMVPHRWPVVSTLTFEEAEQLYRARALLEGFAGRECARLRDPETVRDLKDAVARLKAAAAAMDMGELLAAKTKFYAVLMTGCHNTFIANMLRPLHDRITVLRTTSMSQPGRINMSLKEVTAIVEAIERGDPVAAEKCCIDHIEAAATAALQMIRPDGQVPSQSQGSQKWRDRA